MSWKPIVKMLLAALIPIVYSAIKAQNPTFPLASNEFVELILWIVGAAIGGWEMNKARVEAALSRKKLVSYEKLVQK